MSEFTGAEFTGERVIPGLVDDNLLNEHLARYRFAARFAARFPDAAHVLDAGCGAGYGTAEFSTAASVTAADISADAIGHARANFLRPGVTFLQASCEAIPFADATFDLVTAFEVIEHLPHWQLLLTEARRVLKPTGVLLVSTPNKSYYAESRAAAGPNPFHTHEFEYEEFETALYAVFPHLRMWTQNHSEAIVFAPLNPTVAELDAPGDPATGKANFYLAACSQSPIANAGVYAWMPSTANLLREREHHIAKLESELVKKDAWLKQVIADHSGLQQRHEETLRELKQHNEWAARLNREIREARTVISTLQADHEARLGWVRRLEADLASSHAEIFRLEIEVAARTVWAQSLEAQLETRSRHVQLQIQEIAEHTAHLEQQARLLETQSHHLSSLLAERRLVAASKWIRLGRKLGLGPEINPGAPE